jgi:hypothetical protein
LMWSIGSMTTARRTLVPIIVPLEPKPVLERIGVRPRKIMFREALPGSQKRDGYGIAGGVPIC